MSNILTNHGSELLLVDLKSKKSLMIQNIIMLEGIINYTIFHMKYGKKLLYSHTLLSYEGDLAKYGFLRVHRGFIINPSFVQGFELGDNKLLLEENLTANVSRRRSGQKAVKQLLRKF